MQHSFRHYPLYDTNSCHCDHSYCGAEMYGLQSGAGGTLEVTTCQSPGQLAEDSFLLHARMDGE